MSGPLVVIGDSLLDVDIVGRVERLCPDAPVPVVDDVVEHPRPGGAALAATMAARDGHEVVLVSAFADDAAADRLRALLSHVRVVEIASGAATSVKSRIRVAGQSLLRIDTGGGPASFGDMPELDAILGQAAAVLVSDYGRGITSLAGVRRALGSLSARTPLVWDPHPRGAIPTPGAHLVTPNQGEARHWLERLGQPVEAPGRSDLALVSAEADALVRAWSARAVAVTLGARGALLSYDDGPPVLTPASAASAVDTCGAGDRFASAAALALGSGAVTSDAVQHAVEAASGYVAAGGPASLRVSARSATMPMESGRGSAVDLAARVAATGGVVVATGGCFDLLHAGHVATLRAARRLGDCLVVCVNSDDSVRRLKGPSRPLVTVEDRVRVLEALECVDAVEVFDEDTPIAALERIRPHVWAKGGDYAGAEMPESAVLRTWGGQTVALPYVQGLSTTSLAHKAASTSQVAAIHNDEETH